MEKTQLAEHEESRYVFIFRKPLKAITEKQIFSYYIYICDTTVLLPFYSVVKLP